MKLAIVVTTYQRNDGKSFEFLTRCLSSIKNQTHQDYKVFLIGDKYEDQDEFGYIATNFLDKEKSFAINLPYAAERSKYAMGSRELWCSGGVNARNIGIDMASAAGYDYVCHIDHDDYWGYDHLEQINKVIESKDYPAFVYTCSTYVDKGILPKDVELDDSIVDALPIPENLIHSSVCVNVKQLPFKYRDLLEVANMILPSDMDMWQRICQHITDNNLKSYLVRKLTCFHPIEFTLC